MLKNHVFDENDPFEIFDFFTRFANETDVLNISEAQVFIDLLTSLADLAATSFRTNFSGASRNGGFTC